MAFRVRKPPTLGALQPDRGLVSRQRPRHLQSPDRPRYRKKRGPSFADVLTTLRWLSCRGKFRVLPLPSRLAKKPLCPNHRVSQPCRIRRRPVALAREIPTSSPSSPRRIPPRTGENTPSKSAKLELRPLLPKHACVRPIVPGGCALFQGMHEHCITSARQSKT
jgi:hypothetical protein